MEPFLAIGEELQMAGHSVAFCMPAQFQGLAEEVSKTFYAMDKGFLELVENEDVRGDHCPSGFDLDQASNDGQTDVGDQTTSAAASSRSACCCRPLPA